MGEERLEIGGKEADGDGEEDDTEKILLVSFLTNSQVFLESSNLVVRTVLVRANRGDWLCHWLILPIFSD